MEIKSKDINKSKKAFVLGIIINIFLSTATLLTPNNSFIKKGHYAQEFFLHGFLDHFDYSIFLCFSLILILSTQLFRTKSIIFWSLCIVSFVTLLNSYGRVGILASIVFLPIILLWFKPNLSKVIVFTIFTLTIIISCFSYTPFQNRASETIKSLRWLYNPPEMNEKIYLNAKYMASKTDSVDIEGFTEKILNDPHWLNDIKNKKPEYETSIGKRYLFMKNSLELILKKPIAGHGVNKFEQVYNSYFVHKEKLKHPHNNFLFILVELGLIGLILMLCIFIKQIKIYFENNKKNNLQIIFPFFFLFIMLFDNYFFNHNTLIFFCLFSFILYQPKINK
tara:strand:- start:25394 stop:26401 length:1008 start_codon:yes stop_codon:yes gene_type:complete